MNNHKNGQQSLLLKKTIIQISVSLSLKTKRVPLAGIKELSG